MSVALQRVQSSLMEALFDEGATLPFLEAVADAGGAPVAQLMITNHHRTLIRSAMSGPVDHDVLSTEAEYQDINPRVQALSTMRVGRTTRDKDFIGYDDMLRDRTYQELIIGCGLGHMAGVPLELSPDRVVGLALHRSIGDDAFCDEEAARLEAIGSACAPVFHLMDLIDGSDARTAIDAIPDAIPAAVITRALRIVEHNAAFDEHFFEEADAFPTRRLGDVLSDTAIASVRAKILHPTNMIGGRFCAEDRRGLRRYIATLTPMPWIGPFPPGPGIAILTLERLLRGKTLDQILAMEAFDLTRAEADIAARLMLGDAVPTIARDRSVTVSTVRTIIRSLLLKTETHRQAELVARLSRLAS